MLRLLDLFSGIGGFSLGMEATKRIKTIGFVEKDKFCQKVLQKNFKNIPIEEDIRNVKGSNYAADIVSGGFPCQPFSVAGKRRGQDDDRYLWDETIRVVAETKPKWFVGENVEGIININNGLVLRQVQTDLEKEGFQVQCLVIPASGIGAWHQRKEFGLLHTPTATEIGMRSEKAMEKRKKYRESIGRKTVPLGNLLEQMQMMYPTPTVGCEEGGEQSKRVEQTKSGAFILRKKNKPNSTFGAKLSDAMLYLERMYKTNDSTASDYKDIGYNPITCKRKINQEKFSIQVLKNNKPGGKLNPNFVEFLMGYPINWTQIDPTE